MNLNEAAIAGAMNVLRQDALAEAGYLALLECLRNSPVPRRSSPKSKSRFIYDQTQLTRQLRSELQEDGWRRAVPVGPAQQLGDVRIAGVHADLVKPPLHVLFEFGNRASYAYNLLTRVPLAIDALNVSLTVFVTPAMALANQIDSNLSSWERLVLELRRLEELSRSLIPGPLMIVGVSD